MPAGVTPTAMAPEGGGATAGDRAQDGSLLHAQPGVLRDEGVALRVEDIGHLQRGPGHGGPGFRLVRDRGRAAGVGTWICSSGLGAACRWRRDRMCLRPHPAVVRAQRGEERRTERHLAIDAPFAALDADHHAWTVDVADLQVTEFAPA